MDAIILRSAAPVPRDATPSPALVYLGTLPAGTRRVARIGLASILDRIAPGASVESFPWQALRYEHCQLIRTALAERYAVGTANVRLANLRGVLKQCWRLGLLTAEEYHRAVDIEPIRGHREPRGRNVPTAQFRALLALCGDDAKGLRDRALITLLRVTGMRRAELVSLDWSAYDTVERTIRVIGKGRKERSIPINDAGVAALERWRPQNPHPAIFVRILRGGHLTDQRLTEQAVQTVLHARCDAAGVPRFDPHDARRSFISSLLQSGVDISTAQQLAGHSSVTTTQRYDRRGDDVKRRAVETLEL